jgi:hypothetical protein
MKTFVFAATLLALTAGSAMAAPGHKFAHKRVGHANKVIVVKHRNVGRLTLFERIKIARSRARLAALQRRVRADGHVTRHERIRVRVAQRHHRALVRKERRH